jgi:hypothetical protein
MHNLTTINRCVWLKWHILSNLGRQPKHVACHDFLSYLLQVFLCNKCCVRMSSYIHSLSIENTTWTLRLKIIYRTIHTMIRTFTVQKTKSHVLWAAQIVWRFKDLRDNLKDFFRHFFAGLIDGMICIKLHPKETRWSARSVSSYLWNIVRLFF